MVWRTKFTLIGQKEVDGAKETYTMTVFTAVLMAGHCNYSLCSACSLHLLIREPNQPGALSEKTKLLISPVNTSYRRSSMVNV